MHRDDPSQRFRLSVQVPAMGVWPSDGRLIPLPAPADRVLVEPAEGPGLRRFEMVPADCGWSSVLSENPVAKAIDSASRACRIGVAARLEKGLAVGSGLWDYGASVAGVLAVHALASNSDAPLDQDAAARLQQAGVPTMAGLLEVIAGYEKETFAGLLFYDTKATDEDVEAGKSAALEAGGRAVASLPPSALVILGDSAAAVGRAKDEAINTIAWRGVWARGRWGPLKGRGAQLARW